MAGTGGPSVGRGASQRGGLRGVPTRVEPLRARIAYTIQLVGQRVDSYAGELCNPRSGLGARNTPREEPASLRGRHRGRADQELRLELVELTREEHRLLEARSGVAWRFFGPYLSERQWGTVREDYSDNGDAWSYFSHDQARSRAYRWGEDGLAGISDDHQRMCFALALWNEADPILKERLFGLTNSEGNHGEDVKEYYFYVDNVPTHA